MRNFRTGMIAMSVAAAMAGSHAFAADGTLAPGKPAGVHQAARHISRGWLIGGAVIVTVAGVGIGLATANNSQCGQACVPATATTTS